MAKKKKSNKVMKFISLIVFIALIVCLSILSYMIIQANLLPLKYELIIFGVLLAFVLFFSIFIFKKKTNVIALIIIDILSIGIIGGSIYIIPKFDEAIDFLKNNLSIQFVTNVYI